MAGSIDTTGTVAPAGVAPPNDTRDRLIASAVELMAEHGSVDKVSLRSIASGAGVSPTAVYRHFSDHDAVLVETTRWCWARFDEAINGASASIDDPFEAMRVQCDSYLRFAAEQPGIYRVLFSTVGSVGSVRQEVGYPVFQKLVDSVERALLALGDEREPLAVALQAFTWVHGIADLALANVELPFPEPAGQVTGMLEALRLAKPA